MSVETAEQDKSSVASPAPGSLLPPGSIVFGLLGLAWLALFHFLGNSVLGYFKMPSLFGWMVGTYENFPDDRIGYVMPFVALGILWWRRKELAAIPKKPSLLGAAVVAIALGIHVVGYLVQQSRISIGAFYFGIWGLAGAVWGAGVLRATFFPFCLLVFCVPLSSMTDSLTFPLRQLATKITVKVCHWILGIPVQQAGSGGTMILDPSGRYHYEVAAACSGIRSITAILGLTACYGFVFFRRSWKRLLIIGSAVPLAVISNVLRLLSIVLAAEAFGSEAGNYVHESEWISMLPYIVGFAGVILMGRWLKEDEHPDLRELAIPIAVAVGAQWAVRAGVLQWVPKNSMHLVYVGGAALVLAVFCFRNAKWRTEMAGRFLVFGAACLVAIGGTAGYLTHRQATQRIGNPALRLVNQPLQVLEDKSTNTFVGAQQTIFLPESVGEYKSHSYPLSRVVFDWLPKDTSYGQRIYSAPDGFAVQSMAVLMGADRSSIHKPQHCIRGQGWNIVSEERDVIRIEKPVPYDLPVTKIKFRAAMQNAQGERQDIGGVFIYWFTSENNVSADDSQRMWQIGWNLMRTGVMERWASVIDVIYTPPGREDEAYTRLKAFIQESVPMFQAAPRSALASAK